MTYYEEYQKQSRGKWASRTRFNLRSLPLYQPSEGHILKLERNYCEAKAKNDTQIKGYEEERTEIKEVQNLLKNVGK